MIWLQETLTLPAFPRGFHLITSHVVSALPQLQQLDVGLAQLFIQHTSASLTINENADPDVPLDMETAMNLVVPESSAFRHTMEGPDDMPAHVKASLMGSSVLIPVRRGHFALGTWQGIYLCEHRNHGGRRRVVITAWGSNQPRE